MPRFVIYDTASGRVARHGYVAVAADLGTVAASETAIEDGTLFETDRDYDWSGSAFVDAGLKMKILLHTSSAQADGTDVPIAAGPGWTLIERIFTKIGFFSLDATGLFVNAVALVTSDGTVEIRIVEDQGHDESGVQHYDGADDSVLIDNSGAGFITLSDSSGEWRNVDIKSDQPLAITTTQSEYRLEARLGTATTATVRAQSLALLESVGA